MNGMLVAFLTQSLLLFATTAGFNQPSSAASSDYLERVSTETVQKSLYLKPGGLILLDTEYGNVSVEEYSGKEIRVEMKLQGSPAGISNFRFTHNYFRDQLTLKGWFEHANGNMNSGLRQVDFVIMVPRASAYAVRAMTKYGNIHAAASRNMKDVELSTEAGKVTVAVPSDLPANIDASTSELGEVRVLPAKMFSKLCPKCEINENDHLKVRVNGGGPTISAYSGIGSVYLEITPAVKDNQS